MSEHNLQICRFCQRYMKLAYYCEKCGVSSCSDCLQEEKKDFLICRECGSKSISISESGKHQECKNCGSEEFSQSSQILKSCPKCHSTSIINIYEKKEELEKSFLDLIKNVRTFVDPLNKLVNHMYQVRQLIKNARAPPIKCYHFSNLEPDLLALFKLLVYAKENIQEKISILFNHLSLNKEYFFDIYTQPNANVIIIQGILENLMINYESIKEYVTNNVKTINSSLKTIEKNLKFIDKITFYFETYKKYLNLADEEKPIYSIYAKLANGLNSHDKYKKSKGVLFITNLDLSFVKEYGLIKKKKETIFKAPVEDLIKIRVHGKVFKKLYIEFPYGRYEFSLPPNSINKVLDYIVLARNFDETIKFDEDAAQKLDNYYIDLNEITAYIEETINSFFSLKCQYNTQYQQEKIHKKQEILINNPNQLLHNVSKQIPSYNYDAFIKNPYTSEISNFYSKAHPPNQYFYNPGVKSKYENFHSYVNPEYNAEFETRFIPQSFFNPHRIQNYESYRYSSPYNNQITDPNEKNILMKKLEQINRPHIFQPNNRYPEYDYEATKYYSKKPYQDFSKNHLSDLFDRNDPSLNYPKTPKLYSKKVREKQKKMDELEKERYGLDETLKALDTKFDQGVISEVDYFRTFKNLQKQIYAIDQKIESLGEEIDKLTVNSHLKDFEGKRYYT